jgi:hypothetical protein
LILSQYQHVSSSSFRRQDSLDVEIAASGFTRDIEQTFDEVSDPADPLSFLGLFALLCY